MSDNEINVKTSIVTVVICVIISVVICYVIILRNCDPVFGELIHDTGWRSLTPSTIHGICTLDNPNVFVYMMGRSSGMESHQMQYGADRCYPSGPDGVGTMVGASWSVKKIEDGYRLWVTREKDDILYLEVRVLVWQLPS